MVKKISVLIITKNAAATLKKTLLSIRTFASEIIIVDNCSTDSTHTIADTFGARFFTRKEKDLGKQKAYGLQQIKGPWVLLLDSDEVISNRLQREIKKILATGSIYSAFYIPYQNHFLGKPIHYGGENYRMVRLFKKKNAVIKGALLHEKVSITNGRIGELKNKIYHYSYRSLPQLFSKFTDYAWREAQQKKRHGEKVTIKKLTLYPLHMMWARFIKDKGYKDGLFRLPLDFAFAYMEFATYFFMLFVQ